MLKKSLLIALLQFGLIFGGDVGAAEVRINPANIAVPHAASTPNGAHFPPGVGSHFTLPIPPGIQFLLDHIFSGLCHLPNASPC